MEYRKKKHYSMWIAPYYQHVYRFLCAMTRNEELAADLCQETFELAWCRMEQLREKEAAKSWLFTIATNKAKHYYRAADAKKRPPELSTEAELEELESLQAVEADILEQIIQKDDKRRAMMALERVEYGSRLLLHLYLIDELTFKQIGEMLQKPTTTVQYQYKRALSLLREEYYKLEGGDR